MTNLKRTSLCLTERALIKLNKLAERYKESKSRIISDLINEEYRKMDDIEKNCSTKNF